MKSLTFLLWALVPPLLLSQANSTLAESLCDAREVQLKNNFIQIEPNGLDDTANIQCALDQAVERNIPEVRLTRGDFYISALAVQNFRGTLQGGGKAFTRVMLREGSIDCAARSSAITFAGGEPRVRWLSLGWDWLVEPCTESSRSVGELTTLLHFTGTRTETSSCSSDVISAAIDRVDLWGPRGGIWFGGTYSNAVKVEPTVEDSVCRNALLGSFKLNRSRIYWFDVAVSLRMRGGATVGIHKNKFINNHSGLIFADSAATVTVAGNVFQNITPRHYLVCGGTGMRVANSEIYSAVTRLDVHGNTFGIFNSEYCPGRGLALLRAPNAAHVSIVVSNNTFNRDLEGSEMRGAYAVESEGVSGAVINDNLFAKGSDGMTSILVNATGTSGVSGWTIVSNRWLGAYDTNWADIVLGENVSNTLIGPEQSAVVADYGYDNTVLPQQ